jgi:CxxC-x17-CxxC domain-containing protein
VQRVRSDFKTGFCIAIVRELKYSMYEKEMHKAVCAECKKECEVPFKPDPARPVYCRDCYSKKAPARRY